MGSGAVWLTGLLGLGSKVALANDGNLRLLGWVAAAVLPTGLGSAEYRRVAERLLDWLDAHDPNAEAEQYSPYEYSPNAHPPAPYARSRIDADLSEIESVSAQTFSRSFEHLELREQQDLLRQLVEQREPGLAVRGGLFRQDGHVVLSLLDFYYNHSKNGAPRYRPDGFPVGRE